MPVPATTGQLRSRIEDMKIGDYIVWKYDSTNGNFFSGNVTTYTEIPITGSPYGSPPTHYYFYAVKIAKGLLVADRVTGHSVSWDGLNYNKIIQGVPRIISGTAGVIRSLTGGVAYADENGNKSLTDKGFGAFPTNNEYDRYIKGFPQELIQDGKTLNDIFHINNIYSWSQDTVLTGQNMSGYPTASSSHVIRGYENRIDAYAILKGFSWSTSTTVNTEIGFRPVFEYKEV